MKAYEVPVETRRDATAGRSLRERAATNDGDVYGRNREIHSWFPHVETCPNTLYAETRYAEILRASVAEKQVLELGCGSGEFGHKLLLAGAASVHGIDIAERAIQQAAVLGADDQRLSFELADAATINGAKFDVIVGNAILHHLDWRPVVKRLYDDVLKPGGLMIFSEPLGSHFLLRLYWALFPRAHTIDEAPLRRGDIRWLKKTFAKLELHPTNYVSLYTALLSSRVCKAPDNVLNRLAHAMDRGLEHVEFMKPAFRYGLIVIRK